MATNLPKLMLLASLTVWATAGGAATGINNDACLTRTGSEGLTACSALTDAIGRDLPRLNAHARVLEELGRHESALVMYQAATTFFPRDKRALQGLVRSRANARASRIILDLTPQPADTSPCWTERWLQAFTACREETEAQPGDARLHERLGDVARSVGDVAAAQLAYARSLEIQPDNANLQRKRNALTQLLAGSNVRLAEAPVAEPAADEPPPKAAAPVKTSAASFARSVGDNAEDDAVRKLELLETLRDKGLIQPQEYADRRSSLLASVFDVPATPPVAAASQPVKPVSYRGLHAGRYLALVVGNDRYANYPELATAAADADAVSQLLRNRYGFEVTTLLDANRFQIMSALSDLRRTASADDSILLYYAGHGLLDEQADRGYWLPVDAARDNMAQWISTTDIAGFFAGSVAKHALVIADSCFAGTLLRSADATGLETLQRLAAKRSRTVLTSGGLEPVIDDGDGTHSVFAVALLDALSVNDTVMEASKLFAQVRDRVVLNADQTPQYSPMQRAGHAGGDFLFIPKTVPGQNGTH